MKSGFKPVLSVCDNHSINRKLYRNISGKTDSELMIDPVIDNPYDSTRKIVLSHDSVHVMKCLRNNWFRKSSWKLDDNSNISWNLLQQLFEHEQELPVRKAHPLSSKALKPNNIDKQKVKLAYNVISWPVRNALLYYSETSPDQFPPQDVKSTVCFMDAARNFFDVLNINHVKKGPISSFTSKKVTLLENLWQYFEEINKTGIFTAETYLALQQTINGSLQVIKILLDSDPGNVKVFTAWFQQDPIEEHFGHQRTLSGCSYRVTPLQFTQAERKLSNLSSLATNATTSTSREKKHPLDWNEEPFRNSKKFQVLLSFNIN